MDDLKPDLSLMTAPTIYIRLVFITRHLYLGINPIELYLPLSAYLQSRRPLLKNVVDLCSNQM